MRIVPATRALVLGVALFAAPALLIVPSTAAAQDMCEVMNHDEWAELMHRIDLEIARFDLDMANDLISRTHRRVPCLKTIVRPSYLTRFTRQRVVLSFFKQDEDLLMRWGLAQRYMLADYPWPADMGDDHPIRMALADLEEATLGGPEGRGLELPKKGSFFLNGVPIYKPEARLDVPGLVQLTDGSGKIIDAYWQDGANFPDAYLNSAPDTKLKPPKWFTPEDTAAAIADAKARAPISDEEIAAAKAKDDERRKKSIAEAEAAARATEAAAAAAAYEVNVDEPEVREIPPVDYSYQIAAWQTAAGGEVRASFKTAEQIAALESGGAGAVAVVAVAAPVATAPATVPTPSQPAVADVKPSTADTEPAAVDAKPPADTTEPAVADAKPPADTTEPAVADAKPPADTTEPAVADTTPPADTTEPAVADTEPADTTEPAVADATEPADTTPPADAIKPDHGGGSKLPLFQNVNTTRLGISGGAVALASTFYVIAAVSSGGMKKANNEQDLVSARSRTNTMVFGATFAGLAAVGVGVTAFVDADGAALRLKGRW